MKTHYCPRTKLIALVLVFVMVLPMVLSGCGKKELTWSETEGDYIGLGMDVSKTDNHYTVTLTSADAAFEKKVSADTIKINAAYTNETKTATETEAAEPEIVEDTITDLNVTRDSENKLTVTFDASTDYEMMLVGVHKSAMSNGKYGDAYWIKESEEFVSYSAKIDGTYKTYEANPVIKLTLENTACADQLTAAMFTLSGAFADLTVTGASGNGYTVTLTTEGKINDSSAYGTVAMTETATKANVEMEATATVVPVGAAVLNNSYKVSDGAFEFKVRLGNSIFTVDKTALVSAITADGLNVGIKELGTDYAVLTIATSVADVDAALEVLGGKTVTIAASALSTGKETTVVIDGCRAEANFVVDYISKDGETYKAEAMLFALYGDMGEIAKTDITLGGDFEGASIVSVTKNNNVYEVVFTFAAPYSDFNHEDCKLNGTLTVAFGKIKNAWGTNGENTCAYTYIFDDDMNKEHFGEDVDSLAAFLAAHGDSISKIGTTASVIGGVASAVSGVNTVLEIAGVVESTNKKLDNIKQAIEDISYNVNQLSSKMDTLNHAVIGSIAIVSNKIDQNTYINVCNYWNTYMGTYVGNLNNIMGSFEEQYRLNLIQFLNNPNNTEIKIYIDSDGNVTLPGVISGVSLDGKNIVTEYTCKGNSAAVQSLLNSMLRKGTLLSNRRVFSGEFYKDIENGFADADLLIDTNTSTVVTTSTLSKTQQYKAMTAYFAYLALQNVGVENVLNAYTAFCYRLGGGGDTSPTGIRAGRTYIDDFYSMMTLYYNFYDEAKSDIELMKVYLESVLVKAHDLAVFAQAYTTHEDTVRNASASLEKTLDKKALGEDYVPAPLVNHDESKFGPIIRHFSFVIGKELTVKPGLLNVCGCGVGEDNILMIYGRYRILKAAGITNAPNIFEYLCGDKAKQMNDYLDGKIQHIIVNTTNEYEYKPDGSVSAIASGYGDYFRNDQVNTIDCSGGREKEYYSHLKKSDGTFISLDGKIYKEQLTVGGYYKENHWYWRTLESWRFSPNRTYHGIAVIQ